MFENGGGGVFVAIHQETNQRLTRAWLAFRCVFKTQDDLKVNHFAGSQVGMVLRRADAAGGEDGPRLHFNVVFHTVVETRPKTLVTGNNGPEDDIRLTDMVAAASSSQPSGNRK